MEQTKLDRFNRLRMTDDSRRDEFHQRLAEVEVALEDAMSLIDGMIELIEHDFPFEEVEE